MAALAGKVAFITGAGRGQGRAHALRLAADGCDVIAVDICSTPAEYSYANATAEELEQTKRLVEKTGQRASIQIADVRSLAAQEAAYRAGIEELGVSSVDIAIANAGTSFMPPKGDRPEAFGQSLDVLLTGAYYTVRVTAPDMITAAKGGSILLISSSAALSGYWGGFAGADGYTAAKAGLVGLMHMFANQLGRHSIRVNTIHPTGVRTAMTENEITAAYRKNWREGAANPLFSPRRNVLPVEMLDPEDIAHAVAWLVSDQGKFVTGVALPVDAGWVNN